MTFAKPEFSYHNQNQWFPIKNASSEEAPAFGIMEITGTELSQKRQTIIKVTKPTAAPFEGLYIINSGSPILPEGYGIGTIVGPALVKTLGTPVVGDSWGVDSANWYIETDGDGFFVIGMEEDGQALCVQSLFASNIKPWCRFTLSNALTTSEASNAAVITNQYGPGRDNTTSITVHNLLTHAAGVYLFYGDSGDAGLARWRGDGTNYIIVQLECP